METRETLLIEFAKALDKASALARAISELPGMSVELKLDEESYFQAVYKANRDNHGASGPSSAD